MFLSCHVWTRSLRGLVAASYTAVAGAPLLVRGHTLVREHILVAASYAAVPLLVRGLDQKLAGDDVVCV